MTSQDLRKSFLDFFKEKNHKIVPSMSLIPKDDPSLLFTSAGMVQFKPLWAGSVPLPYRRAVSIQKCLRLSDLENVGKTRRHHTFFEMLGNFSFGDYFKEEAILWAWDYLNKVLKIDKKRLYVSVHKDDDTAYDIWHRKVGLKPERIFRLRDEHNFWGPAGNSGPCGPCSEIFYDLGEKFSCGKSTCAPGCDCDRYPEIWNLVFPQFNQLPSAERQPLVNKGVDTGMGLERLVSILQNKNSNFHTDLFYPIIEEILHLGKIGYGENGSGDTSINIIADHTRALVFAIGDGIIPSNEERGYVVRRLLRRAVRLCRNLGINESFLYKLVPNVIQNYQANYPDLTQRREEITLVVKTEEERFLMTLEKGLLQFEEIIKKKGAVSGKDAFKLYDTYGFPVELTQEIAKEKNIKVDEKEFMKMLAEAREISKAKAKFVPKGEWKTVKEGIGKFVGYEKDEIKTEILRYNAYDNIIEIVLKESPFYAEAGGQIGDQGEIAGEKFKLNVLDTYWYQSMIVCHCHIARGKFLPGKVSARVDMKKRKETARAHTSTHLLHAALRKTLGEHARQEGSFVEPGRFRFDFTHFKPLSNDELDAIENLVNEKILAAIPVEKFHTTLDEAKKMGAMAIFGEKYGNEVRVVKIGDFSIELCAGIHLDNTGEIGLFKVVAQESTAAGIRRVEAVVGLRLFDEYRKNLKIVSEVSQLFGADKDLIKKANDIQERLKGLEKMDQENRLKLAGIEATKLSDKINKEKVKFLAKKLNNYSPEELRMIADSIRADATNSIVVLYQDINDKINYLIFVGENLIKTHPANELVKEVSKILGGGGGGKDYMAEGGGGNPDKIPETIEYLENLLKK